MLILVLPTSQILKTVWSKWYDGTCQHIMLEGSLLWLRNHITPSLVRCLNATGISLAFLQIHPLYQQMVLCRGVQKISSLLWLSKSLIIPQVSRSLLFLRLVSHCSAFWHTFRFVVCPPLEVMLLSVTGV